MGEKNKIVSTLQYAVASLIIMSSAPANAGVFSEQYKKFGTEMTDLNLELVGMFGFGLTILISFATWRYTKRGVNSV